MVLVLLTVDAGRVVKLLQASRNLPSRTVLQRREFLRRRGQSSSTLSNGRSPLGSSWSLVSNTRSSHGRLSAMILSYTAIFYLSSAALLSLLTRRLFLTVCAESCRNGKRPFAPVCLVSTTDHRPPTSWRRYITTRIENLFKSTHSRVFNRPSPLKKCTGEFFYICSDD